MDIDQLQLASSQSPNAMLETANYHIKRTRYGLMMYNPKDIYCGAILDIHGEFSPGEVEIFEMVLRPGYVAVEMGANIGCHTVAMSKLVGASGLVLAFEPQRLIHQILCANVALNDLSNVHVIHKACGAEKGAILTAPLDQTVYQNFGGFSYDDKHAHGDPTEVAALDDYHLAACHLIKVDVEGWEYQALSGARKTIEAHRPILYVENNQIGKQGSLIRLIESFGYKCYWHVPPIVSSPQNRFFYSEFDLYAGVVSHNMVCIHKETDVAEVPFELATADEVGEKIYADINGVRTEFVFGFDITLRNKE